MSDSYRNADVNADKVRKDIFDLKDKKQTLILSIQNDIDGINDRMAKEFCLIGEKAYELFSGGTNSFADFKDDFASIDRHKADRAAKEKKIEEITERYDEEITLLEKLVPVVVKEFCTNCGTPCKPGIDAFCMNCGAKI